MQLIALRQQPDVCASVDPGKPVLRPLAPLQLADLQKLPRQMLDLDAGIAADLLQEAR